MFNGFGFPFGSIFCHFSFVPDEEVGKFFATTDVVVLPYKTASQSGIVQIAYHYDTPVIVSNVGGLPEIVDDGKSGFIIQPENPDELANVLTNNLGTPVFDEMANYIHDYKKKFSWDYFVEGIESVYRKI